MASYKSSFPLLGEEGFISGAGSSMGSSCLLHRYSRNLGKKSRALAMAGSSGMLGRSWELCRRLWDRQWDKISK